MQAARLRWVVAFTQHLDLLDPASLMASSQVGSGQVPAPSKELLQETWPLHPLVGAWVDGLGFVTRPRKCRRVPDASAADVWRSVRDDGSGWTRRSMAKIFPGCDYVYLITGWHSSVTLWVCARCLVSVHRVTSRWPLLGWELPLLHLDRGGKGPQLLLTALQTLALPVTRCLYSFLSLLLLEKLLNDIYFYISVMLKSIYMLIY